MKHVTLGIATLFACALISMLPARAAHHIRGQIEAVNDAVEVAFAAGDAAAFAALYTADGMVLPPGGEAVSGRADIEAFWQGFIDSGATGLELTTDEVIGTGESVTEVGRFRLVGGDGVEVFGKYLVVWKQEDGQWRLHRDIWNADPAAMTE